MSTTIRRVVHSAGFYPVTGLYLAAVLAVWLTVAGLIDLAAAVAGLGVVAVLAVGYATWRELRTLHELLDIQRAELEALLERGDLL